MIESIAPGGAYPLQEATSNRMESVRAVNIQVEHETHLHADQDSLPDYIASIEITGRPANDGFSARGALICFYPDGHPGISRPSYDEVRRVIKICYPISMFESQVEILTRHYDIECTYLESSALPHREAFLQGSRLIPEQMH
ncbi:MAG: hypothetical protein AUJ57_03265 [Zetaproteobacteria bacterium CG1_02_53_45]|nr:MAG: hypothetical protein AUJ57_03265 [Zetaproteobacteria bacterium CG1_02_53_45]